MKSRGLSVCCFDGISFFLFICNYGLIGGERTTNLIYMCFFFAVTVLCFIWLTKHLVDSQLSAPEKLTAPKGGSVVIPCRYEQQYRENTKYWCKGSVYELCKIVVKTPKNRSNDRIFIEDDKEAGVFTVTMTSVRDSDADVYWCVISMTGRNVNKRVKILVSHTGTVNLFKMYFSFAFLILVE